MAATHLNKALRAEKEYAARVKANANRPEHEVTTSLIDSIHALCYLLKDRDLTHPDVNAAIDDLQDNSIGFSRIINQYLQKMKPSNGGPGIKL